MCPGVVGHMPILENAPPTADLAQGDILQGVRLFQTDEPWLDGGGEAKKAPGGLCLVLSRPCVAAHKDRIVVANIAKYPDNQPKEIADFQRALDFMISMRDGTGSPDVFFLGQIPNLSGRYCARLDAIFTIGIPRSRDDRLKFVEVRRIARLSADFARDLHLRLFQSFANLGFNDQSWFPDHELEWLVNLGQRDIKTAESELLKKQAERGARDAQGLQNKTGEIEKLQGNLQRIRDQVAPFVKELQQRQSSDAQSDG